MLLKMPGGISVVTIMKRKILTITFLLFIVFSGGILLYRPSEQDSRATSLLEINRFLMGTSWTIKVPVSGKESGKGPLEVIDSAFQELARIEELMSEWRPETPLSRINRESGIKPVEVPVELKEIIERGIEYGRLSDGAFDITWLGMGGLWHFGDDFRIPESHEVSEALARVDFRKIEVEGNQVFLPEKGMAIGLGGIAKGYAIDRAAKIMRDAGIRDFLIDGGGDILVEGRVGDRAWRVGVRNPRGGTGDLITKISVPGGAVVTSGDYERFKMVNGRRFHHIIDPRTGWPADQCRSVTLYSSSAERADVLATAVFILGVKKGSALVQKFADAEAMIVDSNGEIIMTEGFKKLIAERGGG